MAPRKRLDSKRKYDEDNVTEVEEEKPWQQGGNQRRRKVNYGTSGVMVAGGEAAPYEVFIGNTNPGSTETIIKDVLLQCSESVPEEMKLQEPLQVLEVVCLTRPSTDGTPLRTKCWKVVVPNKFREHMMRHEAFPMGWSHRRFFPKSNKPRAPSVPPLDPVQKRANLGAGHSQSTQ